MLKENLLRLGCVNVHRQAQGWWWMSSSIDLHLSFWSCLVWLVSDLQVTSASLPLGFRTHALLHVPSRDLSLGPHTPATRWSISPSILSHCFFSKLFNPCTILEVIMCIYFAQCQSLDHFLLVLRTRNTEVYLHRHWWSHELNAAPEAEWLKKLLIPNNLVLNKASGYGTTSHE